jgi:hypothetical protein
VTSPNIWQSLLAFNLGVEVGQVLIVIITIIVFYMIGMIGQRATQISRYLITGSCTTISLFWVIERSNSILSNI